MQCIRMKISERRVKCVFACVKCQNVFLWLFSPNENSWMSNQIINFYQLVNYISHAPNVQIRLYRPARKWTIYTLLKFAIVTPIRAFICCVSFNMHHPITSHPTSNHYTSNFLITRIKWQTLWTHCKTITVLSWMDGETMPLVLSVSIYSLYSNFPFPSKIRSKPSIKSSWYWWCDIHTRVS